MCSHAMLTGSSKSAWAGAAWIQKEHASAQLHCWLVGMSEDDCRDAGGFGIEVELLHIMQQVDAAAGELDQLGGWQMAACVAFVGVATNRCYRSDFGQGGEDLWISDISGMKDMFCTLQCLERFRPQQAVGIGNHADAHLARARLPCASADRDSRAARRR